MKKIREETSREGELTIFSQSRGLQYKRYFGTSRRQERCTTRDILALQTGQLPATRTKLHKRISVHSKLFIKLNYDCHENDLVPTALPREVAIIIIL
jgi:hypothetical protein